MLKIGNLNVCYGVIQALSDVNIEVKKGEIVAIIGSNGAGKSTLLKAVSNLIPCRNGSIQFKDKSILGMEPHEIVKLGVSHCPEGRRIFSEMTVYENLLIGASARKGDNLSEDLEKIYKFFPKLKSRLQQNAGTMSGGEQQMLAIGRALMNRPELLLLDEPSLGLAPNRVMEIMSIIKEINKTGTTVLLVEQNAHLSLEIADRGYVLETGKIVMSKNAQELLKDDSIKAAYLGG